MNPMRASGIVRARSGPPVWRTEPLDSPTIRNQGLRMGMP